MTQRSTPGTRRLATSSAAAGDDAVDHDRDLERGRADDEPGQRRVLEAADLGQHREGVVAVLVAGARRRGRHQRRSCG